MTTAYAAAPKWRVMTRRSFAVRGTSEKALQAADEAAAHAARVRLLTPHQWAVWNLGSRYPWRAFRFDKYFDVHLHARDWVREQVLDDCKDFHSRFNRGGASLTSRELLARGEDWLNRHPVRHLPIESAERQNWNYVHSRVMLLGFRISELACIHWRLVRGPILKRAVVLYWQEQTQRALAAPGGAGRKADRAAFESEFGDFESPTTEIFDLFW